MKRLLAAFCALFCAFGMRAQDLPAPDEKYVRLDSMLAGFYSALAGESVDAKCQNADYLIATCKDSLTRQHVALNVFDHYRDSNVMGEEAVAIHVYDYWFENGLVKFQGEMDKMDAEVFIRFNRSSQIGCDAPVLTMPRPCKGTETFPVKGRTSVLFFYDTHCAKCQLEAKLMPSVFKDVDFDMDLYAVYCGTDRKSWRKFRREFRIPNKLVKLHHLWDPEMDSDYQLSYAVIGTPRVYLVEPGGTILGRRLEPESLKELLYYAGAIQSAYDKMLKNQL